MAVGKVGGMKRFELVARLSEIMDPWVSDVDSAGELGEDTNLIADLGLDSVAILQVILDAEKEFGISISDAELDSDSFSSVGKLVTIIEKKLDETD